MAELDLRLTKIVLCLIQTNFKYTQPSMFNAVRHKLGCTSKQAVLCFIIRGGLPAFLNTMKDLAHFRVQPFCKDLLGSFKVSYGNPVKCLCDGTSHQKC